MRGPEGRLNSDDSPRMLRVASTDASPQAGFRSPVYVAASRSECCDLRAYPLRHSFSPVINGHRAWRIRLFFFAM